MQKQMICLLAIFLLLQGIYGMSSAAVNENSSVAARNVTDFNPSMDYDPEEESGFFEMIAGVMEMNLSRNYTIIAEEKIILKYHYTKKGKKVWDTVFLDKKGNRIKPEQIKEYDEVLVFGTRTCNGAFAKQIQMLE